jgi:hypothetical protein
MGESSPHKRLLISPLPVVHRITSLVIGIFLSSCCRIAEVTIIDVEIVEAVEAISAVRASQLTVTVVGVVVGVVAAAVGVGPAAPIIDRASIPRGICQFYWSTGACNRNFDCTYRHEARVQASSSVTQDYTPDFFSLEGLAVNNGSVLDTQHTLSPSEAHNHLRPYVFDNFVFRDAFHIEGFSRILASVNSRNRAWVRQTVTTSNIH